MQPWRSVRLETWTVKHGIKGRGVAIQWWVFLRQSWEEPAETLTQRGQNCLHRPAFLLQATGLRSASNFASSIWGQ